MRLPIVSRAVGFSRDVCWLYGSMNDGVSWNVSTPNVCSTTLPTSDDSGAGERLRRARRQDVGLRLVRVLQRAQLRRRRSCVPRRTSLKSSARTSAVGSGGSELSVGRSCSLVPASAHGHAIGLPGHAHVGLGLDVEERLDARRVGEVDRAARDAVAAPLERHLAALDVGVAGDHRPIVGAAQRAGRRSRPSAPGCSRRAASTAPAPGRRTSAARSAPRSRRPAARRGADRRDARSKMLPGASTRRFQSALFTVTVPPSVGALNGAAQRQVGVDHRADALGIRAGACPRRAP